ncbi:MAG: peptide ABC transporter substrate-binding protein [Simkania sp.]|nr:peptide ABC transporter substrate-binding protein [Simkania sp.]
MKMLSRLLLVLTMMTLTLTGCGKKNVSSDRSSHTAAQSVRFNIGNEPQTLDPRKVRALADVNLVKMFNEGLTRVDKSGKASLALAKDVQVLNGGLTYKFTLHPTKWSNGDALTASDFAYAWKKSLSPSFVSPNSYMLFVIKNAEAVKTGKLPSSLLGIETPDDKTLIVHLSHKIPYFLELTEHPIFFPVNEKLDRKTPNWADNQETYVSNGPFLIHDWKHHNLLEAAKNPTYWDAKAVKLGKLKMVMVSEETGFKMFESQELDWDGSPFSAVPIDAIETLREANQLQTSPVLATSWIRINLEKAPFKSKKMRRAFALAINRQDIVEHVTQGNQIPATGIVPKAMGLQEQPYFKDGQNEEAANLFEEALLELGMAREKLPEIVFTYAAGDRTHPVAQALQQQWYATLGVRVRLEPMEPKVYFSRVSKQDYTLALGSWFADFNDPINFLEVFKTKTNGTNNTNWENPSYAELLETSYTCQNPEERLAYLKQSEQLIMDEMPVIPVFYYTLLFVKDEGLKNVVLTKTGNIDFKWAELNK